MAFLELNSAVVIARNTKLEKCYKTRWDLDSAVVGLARASLQLTAAVGREKALSYRRSAWQLEAPHHERRGACGPARQELLGGLTQRCGRAMGARDQAALAGPRCFCGHFCRRRVHKVHVKWIMQCIRTRTRCVRCNTHALLYATVEGDACRSAALSRLLAKANALLVQTVCCYLGRTSATFSRTKVSRRPVGSEFWRDSVGSRQKQGSLPGFWGVRLPPPPVTAAPFPPSRRRLAPSTPHPAPHPTQLPPKQRHGQNKETQRRRCRRADGLSRGLHANQRFCKFHRVSPNARLRCWCRP